MRTSAQVLDDVEAAMSAPFRTGDGVVLDEDVVADMVADLKRMKREQVDKYRLRHGDEEWA
jgi:hypothetical protein